MPEKQSSETLEIRDGVVTELRSLISLFAHDTDSYSGRLDHVDVISSVTDSECQGRLVVLSHQINGGSLLCWRRSVNNNRSGSLEDTCDFLSKLLF